MPSRSTLTIILLLTFLAVVTGWNYFAKPFAHLQSAMQPSPTPLVDASPEPSVVTSPVTDMTTEQKIATILAYPVTLTASPSAAYAVDMEWIAQNQPGAVTIFGSSVSQTQVEQLQQDLAEAYTGETASRQPLLVVDHEGGTVQRLSGAGFTRLPSWRTLCAQPATSSADVLRTSLSEVKNAGIDIILSPTIDVASSHAVLRDRICSGDPEVVVERSLSFIEVAQSVGIKPVLKHFPGIGKTTRDLHTSFDRVSVTPEDALVFKYVLEKYPQLGVMVSPVGVNNQYPDVPCTVSVDCVKELSSNFPEVLVVSDGLEMTAARYSESGELLSLAETAVRAARAGNNLLIFGPQVTADQMSEVFTSLVTAYEADPVLQSAVDTSVRKVLEVESRQP